MTKIFLDSAYAPNDAQLNVAKSSGVAGWNGYFAGPNILNGWQKADFDRVKAHGLATMAYCSGWAGAAAMRSLGVSWGVHTALDVEGGIRALIDPSDKPYLMAAQPRPVEFRSVTPGRREIVLGLDTASAWLQAWLDASGAGLYGNYWVHPGVRAPFYILAAYPTSGDPTQATWWSGSPRPGALCGWQWAGSHNFAGITVDSNYFDDGLYQLLAAGPQPQPPTPEVDDMLFAGPFHPLPATVTAYVAGSYYLEPVAAAEVRGGDVSKGATYHLTGYRWTSSAVQSTTPAGADQVWWAVDSGGWIPDAYLDTSHVAGAPGFTPPARELAVYVPTGAGGGVSADQVKQQIDSALASLTITRKTQLEPE